jgi:hypothetical protein
MAQAADDLVVQTTRFFVCCTSHPNLYIACGTSTGPSENLAASCSILLSRLWMHYKSLQRDIQKVPQGQEYPSATRCNQKTIIWKSRWRARFGRCKGNNRQVRVAQYVWLKFSILACEHVWTRCNWKRGEEKVKHVKHLAHHISSYPCDEVTCEVDCTAKIFRRDSHLGFHRSLAHQSHHISSQASGEFSVSPVPTFCRESERARASEEGLMA